MKEIVFGQDGDFSEERFRFTVNAHLANDIGNLTNRCLNLLKKNCDSSYPLPAAAVPKDHPLRIVAANATEVSANAYNDFAMHDAITSALSITGRFDFRSSDLTCFQLCWLLFGSLFCCH